MRKVSLGVRLVFTVEAGGGREKRVRYYGAGVVGGESMGNDSALHQAYIGVNFRQGVAVGGAVGSHRLFRCRAASKGLWFSILPYVRVAMVVCWAGGDCIDSVMGSRCVLLQRPSVCPLLVDRRG